MEDMAALWYPGQVPVVRCRCGPALPSYAARRTASPEVPLLRRKSLYCRLFVPHCGHCRLFGQTGKSRKGIDTLRFFVAAGSANRALAR